MTPLERAIQAGDLLRAQSILAARVRAKTAAILRRKERRTKVMGATKAERKDAYLAAKQFAMTRATDAGGIRCEVHEHGARCVFRGQDPDHVIGGTRKRECEALGAEGLMIMCRAHHDLKHANAPTHAYWLEIAREHAIRIGGKGLLALVDQAIARDGARHPEHWSRIEVRDG